MVESFFGTDRLMKIGLLNLGGRVINLDVSLEGLINIHRESGGGKGGCFVLDFLPFFVGFVFYSRWPFDGFFFMKYFYIFPCCLVQEPLNFCSLKLGTEINSYVNALY